MSSKKQLESPTKRQTRRSLAATSEHLSTDETTTNQTKKKRLSSLDKLVQEATKVIQNTKKPQPEKPQRQQSTDTKSKQKSILDYISPTQKEETVKKRPVRSPTKNKIETPTKASSTQVKKTKKYIELSENESDEQSSESETDDEFEIEEDEESSEVESEQNVSESEVEFNESNSDEDNKKTRRSKRKSTTKKAKEIPLVDIKLIDTINLDEKIEKWEYETEPVSNLYCRPILPALSDQAIQPFLNNKSTKKSTIYDCPFCKNHFTYNLVFKTHLFSCSKNPNVPEYVLFCCKHPECDFKGQRRQEMINHYNKTHVNNLKSLETNLENIHIDKEPAALSTTKKNQLEVSRYYYIDKNQLKYSNDYFNKTIAVNFKPLKYIDHYYQSNQLYKHYLFDINRLNDSLDENCINCSKEPSLTFKLAEFDINLKPFEIYQSKINDQFTLINIINQITSLTWCPTKQDSTDQYLAFSSLKQLNDLRNKVKNVTEFPNLIYLYKTNLNDNNQQLIAIYNKKIGTISTLKWRPDCGASTNLETDFIGYLLATSSNGNGYLFSISDLTKHSLFQPHNLVTDSTITINKLNVFEPTKQICLKSKFSYGQCTSGDWSQLNGATQIALGYTSGEIAIFQVNSNYLNNIYKTVETNDFNIYPIKTFNAHLSFVKDLKWCKFDSNILASGSSFSRNLKVWNIQNCDKPFIEYEIFLTEFEFSLHSNHIFIAKETNLKGENHLFVLDLSFNVFNNEKDESRSKSSLFYTNGTMNSIDQSDYLNKLLICDTDGCVIVASSNNPNHWIPKHQLMFNSFSQIVSFQLMNELTEVNRSYIYNSDDKVNQVISISLDRKLKDKKSKPKENASVINSNRVGLNNLTTIKWNSNCKYLNWYAVGSGSGFVFINKINELKIEHD